MLEAPGECRRHSKLVVVARELVSRAFESFKFEKFSPSPNHGGRQIIFTRAFIFLYPSLKITPTQIYILL